MNDDELKLRIELLELKLALAQRSATPPTPAPTPAPAPTPEPAAPIVQPVSMGPLCRRRWIMRGRARKLHEASGLGGKRHWCTRTEAHPGSCVCQCGASLDVYDQAWQDAGQEGRDTLSAEVAKRAYKPKPKAKTITAEEAGERDAIKHAAPEPGFVHCPHCKATVKKKGLGRHVATAHTEAGAKQNAAAVKTMHALLIGPYKCGLCEKTTRMFNHMALHVHMKHGIEQAQATAMARTYKVQAEEPVDPISQAIMAEVDRKGEASIMDLARAASIMHQKAESIAERLVKAGNLRIVITGGAHRYARPMKNGRVHA